MSNATDPLEATLRRYADAGKKLSSDVWPFDDVEEFNALRTLALRSPDDFHMRERLRSRVSTRTGVRIYYGPPGTGKTLYAVREAVQRIDPAFADGEDFVKVFRRFNELHDQSAFITFHQSLQYEDIVESIRPYLAESDDQATPEEGGSATGDGSALQASATASSAGTSSALGYRLYTGPVMRLIQRALRNPAKEYVIVIDEINRGDISRILGPLISALEPDKRAGAEFPIGFESQYPRVPDVESRIFLPANLHVIGTMNSADRNIALVDYALRRRFEFVQCLPREDLLTSPKSESPIDVRQLLRVINLRLAHLLDLDHSVGHGYFMGCATNADVIDRLARRVLPLLAEYFYGNEANVLLVVGDIGSKQPIYQPPSGEPDFEATFGLSLDAAVDVGYRPSRSRIALRFHPRFWNPQRLVPGPEDEAYAVAAIKKIYGAPANAGVQRAAAPAGPAEPSPPQPPT
jgi:5-methylcytosine-specific restriction protein B